MPRVTEQQVLQALEKVNDPDKGQNVVALSMIQGLTIRDGHVGFSIEVEVDRGSKLEPLRKACENSVNALPGVLTVTAVLTAEKTGDPEPKPAPPPQARNSDSVRAEANPASKIDLPDVNSIIAVASGKGGVGKSTTAVNLALAMSRLGLSVGVLDADIYGPSIPRMLGINGKPKSDGDNLLPMTNHGLVCMSIGFLIDEDTPVIWRGPMVMGALNQLLRNVNWGQLDVLVVDMPPGTGDVQLTMAQQVPLSGAIIVSTPQDVALLDARKGLNMFRRTEIPVLGMIENMSYFFCPHCGERSDIFGHGGARETAEKLECDFLGAIPLHISIRETSDTGQPVVVSHPNTKEALAFIKVAEIVVEKLANPDQTRKMPKITLE